MGKDRALQNPKRHHYELMNSWATILVLVTVTLFFLPLLPALKELYIPTDVTPLRVVQAYDNDPFHFATGFRNYVHKQFSINSISDLENLLLFNGTLPDGTGYQIIQVSDNGSPNMRLGNENVLLSNYPIILPNDNVFEAEIYSAASIATGKNGRYRALLSDKTLTINDNNVVLRWVHSDGEMRVNTGSVLLGRATSGSSITLAVGSRFERLHAKQIITDELLVQSDGELFVERTKLETIKDTKIKAERRSLLEGDLNFPAYHLFDGDIVAGSTAIIGDYAHIKGSVKSNAMNDVALYLQKTGVTSFKEKIIARCELGHYVRIDGSIISTHDLYIGEHCRIFGPVIAENLLVIRTGTVIGTPEQPCTVSAPRIIIEAGCVVHGTLWAGKEGVVTVSHYNAEGLAA